MFDRQVKFSNFVCEMTEYILKLVAIENSVSSITAVETHSIKTMQFSLLIAVHTSGVAQKNQYWLVATQKTKIGEQFNLVSHSPIWWAIQQWAIQFSEPFNNDPFNLVSHSPIWWAIQQRAIQSSELFYLVLLILTQSVCQSMHSISRVAVVYYLVH